MAVDTAHEQSTPAYIPIAVARQKPRGTEVTIEGLVTAPSGDFRSSSSDEGFAIQDQTAGIWVSLKHNLDLGIGQRVRVGGRLGENNDKVQVVTRQEKVRSLPGQQLRVATGQVGPATLGLIVTVEGTVVPNGFVPDSPDGTKVFIDDGSGQAQIYVNASTNIDPNAPWFQPGSTIRVTGFGNVYLTAYEVDPRLQQDVEPLS